MCRLTLVPSCLVLCLTFGAAAAATFAADPKPADPKPADPAPADAPAIQSTRGRVRVGPDGAVTPKPPPPAKLLKVADGSITVRPAPPTPAKAADAKPAAPAKPANEADAKDAAAAAAGEGKDQTYTVDKQRTRLLIGTAMSERMTVTGQRIRMMRYEPGQLADLEAGQFVDVKAGADGVATEVLIVPDPSAPLPAPATVVAVDGKSITVAPAAAGAPQKTYKLDPATTRVRITTVTGEREGQGGRITRTQSVTRGTTADLKVGQLVQVRAHGDLAVSVEVVPPPLVQPARPARAQPAPAEKK